MKAPRGVVRWARMSRVTLPSNPRGLAALPSARATAVAGFTAWAALAAFAMLFSTGCPRVCAADGDCNEREVCAVTDGKGTCVPAGDGNLVDAGRPGDDAGNDVDAGNEPEVDAGNAEVDAGPDVDAGVEEVDAGPQTMKLRGALEVAPGVLRGGTKALKGRIVAPGAVTATGGTLKLEAGAAPP